MINVFSTDYNVDPTLNRGETTFKQNWNKLKGKVILDCHNICPLSNVYHI